MKVTHMYLVCSPRPQMQVGREPPAHTDQSTRNIFSRTTAELHIISLFLLGKFTLMSRGTSREKQTVINQFE